MSTIENITDMIQAALVELEGEAAALSAALAASNRHTSAATPIPARRGGRRANTGGVDTSAVPDGERPPRAPSAAPQSSAKVKSAARPRTRRARAATIAKEPVKVLLAGQLERMLEDHPDGLSAATIAARANAASRQVNELLKGLEDAGKVRRTGQRRGTRWHALGDEEWIARRAAELEQKSTTSTPRRPVAA